VLLDQCCLHLVKWSIKKDFGEGGKTYYPINWIIELKMMEKCKTTNLKC